MSETRRGATVKMTVLNWMIERMSMPSDYKMLFPMRLV